MKKTVYVLAGIGLLGLIAMGVGLGWLVYKSASIRPRAIGGPIRIREVNQSALARGFIGLSHETISDEQQDTLGIDGGVIVTQVLPGSAADLSGITVGDCLVEADGLPIADRDDLVAISAKWLPDQTVQLKVVRADGNERSERIVEITTVNYEAIERLSTTHSQ